MSDDFSLYLDLQTIVSSDSIPVQSKMEAWLRQALIIEAESVSLPLDDEYELTIRVVDKEEIRALNDTYRHIDKPTNVLSFPYEDLSFDSPMAIPLEVQLPLLGDIVICHDIVIEEAAAQNKLLEAHWAHMVIHGLLHLKGYDHIEDDEAEIMEALEVKILQQLEIANPYL
ncbi:rRNA maturation RNase YbeY [sulfur-oxidizing endosymbiont of Gigantopelta aegis]|uniref:rRNA maturation RNase YbeY n=1 Tax=sulfur-oxidizing endosymbiont of Gigantopelta aegis TaxID=2794934 RepID=UPI0018DC0231|nr:rRNA maturation RNase YbeY [sulfur-oxidizing endosymbiont of Gigantopelta aegis]